MSRSIRNWKEYNRSLINRGSINFWISDDVIEKWASQRPILKGGRPEKYSDSCIEAVCMIRFFFHLSLRATEGFIQSIFGLMNLELPVPSYSRVCRRTRALRLDYKSLSSRCYILVLVVEGRICIPYPLFCGLVLSKPYGFIVKKCVRK